MRQMFVAVASLCVAAACASVVYSHRDGHDNSLLYIVLYFAGFIAAGAGIGSIFGKVITGVGIAIWCGCIVLVVLIMFDGRV
jgi:hypothetical protein